MVRDIYCVDCITESDMVRLSFSIPEARFANLV